MKGVVDDKGRALLQIQVQAQPNGEKSPVTVWIDTAFDGHLVFPAHLITQLNLEPLAETEAILADGSKVVLDTYLCYLQWFGAIHPLQVIKNDGALPLLGVALLNERLLTIDYRQKMLELS